MGADFVSPPLAGLSAGIAEPVRRFPFGPYPTGWYRVAASRDLGPNQVRALSCFGQDLVLFRPNNMEPALLDAHCPHLGAHLGHGGRVIDGNLVCPFHARRFNAAGQCVGIPNAARLRSWAVHEINDAIMLWFDETGRPPQWNVPAIPEFNAPAWSRFRPARSRRVRTHVRELAENGIDLAHFAVIHGGQIAKAESLGLTIEGQILTHRLRNGFTNRISRNKLVFRLGKDGPTHLPGQFEFTYHGLGTMVCRAEVAGRFPVSFVTVLYFLPLDDDFVQVTGELSIRRCGLLTRPLLAIAVRETEKAIAADTAILENKAYLDRPQLAETDGPIMPYRAWAQQFHTVPS